MGQFHSHYLEAVNHPETTPKFHFSPSFDPQYGFMKKRKEKVFDVTLEEKNLGKFSDEEHDSCTRQLINYRKCRLDNQPLFFNCHNQYHKLFHCQENDYIDRLKEYEREWRLRKSHSSK